MVANDQTLEVLFHLSEGLHRHLHRVLADGVHLAVKFKTGNPVSHVDEGCPGVGSDSHVSLF